MARKQTRTEQLEALRQVVVTERQKERDAELAAETAKAEAKAAREALIDAHASGAARGIKTAEAARTTAAAKAEDAAIKAEAAQRRSQRAEQERQAFEVEHARDLIGEMQETAAAVVERLQIAAGELVAADAAWSEIRQRSADLLTAVPGANAAQDSPNGHALGSIAGDLRRVKAEVVSPLPHYRGLDQRREQHELHAGLKHDHPEHRIGTV
jgi:hypothetical protein